jgi:hypothetical protein
MARPVHTNSDVLGAVCRSLPTQGASPDGVGLSRAGPVVWLENWPARYAWFRQAFSRSHPRSMHPRNQPRLQEEATLGNACTIYTCTRGHTKRWAFAMATQHRVSLEEHRCLTLARPQGGGRRRESISFQMHMRVSGLQTLRNVPEKREGKHKQPTVSPAGMRRALVVPFQMREPVKWPALPGY